MEATGSLYSTVLRKLCTGKYLARGIPLPNHQRGCWRKLLVIGAARHRALRELVLEETSGLQIPVAGETTVLQEPGLELCAVKEPGTEQATQTAGAY